MPPGRRSARPRAPRLDTESLVERALGEDRAREDLTTRLLLPRAVPARAKVSAQAEGVLAGMSAAVATARAVGVRARALRPDGSRLRRGTAVLALEGDARAILAAERTLLNFLMHLSGVATATDRAVRRASTAAIALRVRGTRKTTPGLRELEKSAIRSGGGDPHRLDLASGILVKNNHLALLPVEEAVRRARAARAGPVQVEVRTAREALRAVAAGADALLLDNLSPTKARQVIRRIRTQGGVGRIPIELSGGITERTLPSYRRTGADAASLGALTHSAPALPFHLTMRARA